MVREVVNFIDLISPTIILCSNILVFIGSGYVALHSRIMPKWVITCLWYTGLAALLNAITLVVELIEDQMHPLSHFQIGVVTESMMHVMLAVVVTLLFANTIWKDYQWSKLRGAAPEPVEKPTPVKTRGKKPVSKQVAKKAASSSDKDRTVLF